LTFELPLVGLRISLAKVDLAAAEMEPADHAVAVEELIVVDHRRHLRVRMHPVVGAMQLRRQLALDLDIVNVALEPQGTKAAREYRRIGEMGHGCIVLANARGRLYPAGAAFRRTANSNRPDGLSGADRLNLAGQPNH